MENWGKFVDKQKFIVDLHQNILNSSEKFNDLLSDSNVYKKVRTDNNVVKFISPEKYLPSKLKFTSSILENNQKNLDFLHSLFPYRILFLERMFQAKKDGFNAKDFHSKCDKIHPTLLLFKVAYTKEIFGAYVSIPWETPKFPAYFSDKKSFLFSVNKKTKHEVYRNEGYSLLMQKELGPCFGGGSDLRINGENIGHCSNLGFSFKFNANGDYDTKETKTHLAGDIYFTLEDYELFYIEFHF